MEKAVALINNYEYLVYPRLKKQNINGIEITVFSDYKSGHTSINGANVSWLSYDEAKKHFLEALIDAEQENDEDLVHEYQTLLKKLT